MVVRRHPQIKVALDNTWGAGWPWSGRIGSGRGLTKGVDISVHALTKYPGGADVLMGSVVTRDEALHLQLKLAHMRFRPGRGANDAEAVLRGLPNGSDTPRIRCCNAWVAVAQPAQQVRWRFASRFGERAPGHAYWKETCGAAGGGISGVLTSVFVDSDRRLHR